MTITNVTSCDLSQDFAFAKRAAKSGPVFISDREKPVHVLPSIKDDWREAGEDQGLLEALSMDRPRDSLRTPLRRRPKHAIPDTSRRPGFAPLDGTLPTVMAWICGGRERPRWRESVG